MYNNIVQNSKDFLSNYKVYYKSKFLYSSLKSFKEHRRACHMRNAEGRLLLLDVYDSDNVLRGCVGFTAISREHRLTNDVKFVIHLSKSFAEKYLQDIISLLSTTAIRRFQMTSFKTHVLDPHASKDSSMYDDYNPENTAMLCRLLENVGLIKEHPSIQQDDSNITEEQTPEPKAQPTLIE